MNFYLNIVMFHLQRLYSVPSTLRIDLPFGTDSDFTLDDIYNHPIGHAVGMTPQSHNSRTPTTTFASSPASSDGLMSRSGGFAPFSSGCPYVRVSLDNHNSFRMN